MNIIYRSISIRNAGRVICISDIHGNLTLLKMLLDKIKFCENDELFIIGDIFNKGKENRETLRCVMELSEKQNVHPMRGNGDRVNEEHTAEEREWIEALPTVYESEDYIFVHAGLPSMDFTHLDAWSCMKIDAFMENAPRFDKYVITGHWPVNNYNHGIVSLDPIVNKEKKIIAIDGGCVVLEGGQLNAFIMENGRFSYESVDMLTEMTVIRPQKASGDPFTICFQDRFIEVMEAESEFSLCRHMKSGKLLNLPNNAIWTDNEERLCATGTRATTYFMPLSEGDRVKVIDIYSDRVHIKKNGICGYAYKDNLI